VFDFTRQFPGGLALSAAPDDLRNACGSVLDYRDGRRGDGCNHPAQRDAGHGQLLPHSESAHVKIISDEERNRLIADAWRLASACLRRADELREVCEPGRPVTIIDWSTGRAAAYSDNVIPFPLAKRVGHVAQ
jgi:hypothetical protein